MTTIRGDILERVASYQLNIEDIFQRACSSLEQLEAYIDSHGFKIDTDILASIPHHNVRKKVILRAIAERILEGEWEYVIHECASGNMKVIITRFKGDDLD